METQDIKLLDWAFGLARKKGLPISLETNATQETACPMSDRSHETPDTAPHPQSPEDSPSPSSLSNT